MAQIASRTERDRRKRIEVLQGPVEQTEGEPSAGACQQLPGNEISEAQEGMGCEKKTS